MKTTLIRCAVDSDPAGLLDGIRCFALDMDGTVYLGETWIDGALAFIEQIQRTGRQFVFMTNNSSKSAETYREKLARMGLVIGPDQLVTSGHATIDYLKRHYPGQRVYLMGNPALQEEFIARGILLDNSRPEVVVTAFDTTLTYQKLCEVCGFVRSGLPYIATHPDYNCPTETGFIPDIGSFHALIHASTGRMPDRIIGKPGPDIISYMLSVAGASPGETAVVGDRLYTDVASAANNGLTGILVLSGEATLDDLDTSDVQPHLVFSSVRQMTPLLAPY